MLWTGGKKSRFFPRSSMRDRCYTVAVMTVDTRARNEASELELVAANGTHVGGDADEGISG
jgi:hypothetical protein